LVCPALEQVSRLDHPGFFAHMDPPTPWVTWAAATNQNLLHRDTAPAAPQPERLGSTGPRRNSCSTP
jgi:L-2,4-diaminobutyrate decarboxylase